MQKPNELMGYMEDRPAQILRHVAATEKAQNLLQWQAGTHFNEGIESTIKWYEQNRDWWQRQLWMRHVPIKNNDGSIEYY
jgi:dTDP-glucose 4,6-dehydratase